MLRFVNLKETDVKRILLAMSLSAITTPVVAREAGQEEKNKTLVRTFYEEVFVRHHAKEAAEAYLSPDYKQHNPHVPTGRQPFIDYFVPYFVKNPGAQSEIKRIMSDGDLVMVHVHAKGAKKDDPGTAVVDIFRVKDGKIVEHWDVLQAVPTTSAHQNGMF